MQIIEIIQTSGKTGYVIVIVFILGLFLVVERFLAYWRSSRGMRRFDAEFREASKVGDWETAFEVCERNPMSDLKELSEMVLEHGHTGPATLRSSLNNHVDSVLLPRLRARLRELAMMAKLAPMLGLFGTVEGMIDAFSRIAAAQGQGVNPKDLADSIGLALGTTFLGLLAAMPIVCCLSILQSKIESFSIALEQFVERSVSHVAAAPPPEGMMGRRGAGV